MIIEKLKQNNLLNWKIKVDQINMISIEGEAEKTKSPAKKLRDFYIYRWSRRDSNSRPNKELISFLQSLEHNWFSI